MLDLGVAKEVARFVLPVGLYTEFYWTVNARALMNFISLRNATSAQWEIAQYGQAVEDFFADADARHPQSLRRVRTCRALKKLEFDKVLIFFAHPDDGEFMAGGSMIKWVAEGKEIVRLRGHQRISRIERPGGNPRGAHRRPDGGAAGGRQDHRHLRRDLPGLRGLPHAEDSHELRRDMIREIRRFKPDLVIGPDPTTVLLRRSCTSTIPTTARWAPPLCAALKPGGRHPADLPGGAVRQGVRAPPREGCAVRDERRTQLFC